MFLGVSSSGPGSFVGGDEGQGEGEGRRSGKEWEGRRLDELLERDGQGGARLWRVCSVVNNSSVSASE
jgi:hypothetical protein